MNGLSGPCFFKGLLVLKGDTEMTPEDDAVLRTAKEIVIKFIEAGKVSPTTFEKSFKDVFEVVRACVRSA